jgi:methyl-accepting chemotaxis protein
MTKPPDQLPPLLPAALLAALLSACATPAPPAPAPLPPPTMAPAVSTPLTHVSPQDEAAPLLAYHQSLRRMSQGELLKELSGLGLQQATPKLALQTGMILMLTRGAGDLARAQAQFDSVASSSDPAAQSLKPLAQLLSSHCAEARRLSEHADRLTAQLKENQRKTEQLNDMLEGLKAIERNLPVRPSSPPGPQIPGAK